MPSLELASPSLDPEDRYKNKFNASKPVEALVKARCGLKQSQSEVAVNDPTDDVSTEVT